MAFTFSLQALPQLVASQAQQVEVVTGCWVVIYILQKNNDQIQPTSAETERCCHLMTAQRAMANVRLFSSQGTRAQSTSKALSSCSVPLS